MTSFVAVDCATGSILASCDGCAARWREYFPTEGDAWSALFEHAETCPRDRIDEST